MARKRNWTKYAFEFLCIFIAVISAFALNNWNDDRKNSLSEEKILREIRNGLELDLHDIGANRMGHEFGIRACQMFRDLTNNQPVDKDSIKVAYIILLRDFTSIMNLTGYESLKSKGLEIVQNDSLRYKIIALYDYYYQIIYKLEEGVTEMQSFENYFTPINNLLYPYLEFDEKGNLLEINQPISLSQDEQKQLNSFLWRIQNNRAFKLNRYNTIEEKINDLISDIDKEIGD